MNQKVIITVNAAWNLVTFRAGLIRSLVQDGFEVVAVAPIDRHAPRLTSLGCRFVAMPMDNQGTNPFRDAGLFWRYWRLFRRERPDVVLGFTIKPNVYGSLGAHALRIPVVNNIGGLGTTFLSSRWLNRVARILYRVALSRSKVVFFQNVDDLSLFLDAKLVQPGQTRLVPGSGIDTTLFVPTAGRQRSASPLRFLLVARLLWDKGVGDFVDAVASLKAEGVPVDAQLLGMLDAKNPSAIPRERVERWVDEGLITYLGEADDVRPYLADADCVVLPSFREGTPRSLLEAASMGRPIITTDVPGCRNVVMHEINGYVVPVKNVHALADAMKRLIALPKADREKMGQASRTLAITRFDETIVIAAYRNVLMTLRN